MATSKIEEFVTSATSNEARIAKLKNLAAKSSALKAPDSAADWVRSLFPSIVSKDFAKRHLEMLEWSWSLESGKRPRPFVSIQPRGGGKSTNAEIAVVMAGARGKRKYAWYCSETQSLADAHLESIASLIESPIIEAYYPQFAKPYIGKYGSSKMWRRNRLRCKNGFTVDALGLDTAKRGAKLGEARPDFMIFDDIDGRHDGPSVTSKKIDSITTSLLPAGSADLATLFVQNMIISDGVFGRLATPKPPFLSNRILSGPYPALEDFEWWVDEHGEIQINGKPTWVGQDIDTCYSQIQAWGLHAFRRESQHEMIYEGGMFEHIKFEVVNKDDMPPIWKTVVAVDPSVSSTDASDAHGIQVCCLCEDRKVYMMESWEEIATPKRALTKALDLAIKYGASQVLIEGNQGGDLWLYIWDEIVSEANLTEAAIPGVELVKASSGTGGKTERASQMCTDYERGLVIHVEGPSRRILEQSLLRFPLAKPYDLVDAAWWAWNELRISDSWLISETEEQEYDDYEY